MLHPWHDVTPGIGRLPLPAHFRVVVEIPRGASNKYELDKASGLLRLDRVLHSSMHYPANYGFIPQTLAEDNDPLDALVFCSEPAPPLCLCDARAVGLMIMVDDGQADQPLRDESIVWTPFSRGAEVVPCDLGGTRRHG